MKKKGDNFQYGGPRLLVEKFLTPDGFGHFTAVELPSEKVPEGQFLLSTRRGKQFNSIIHADKDPITGARRDDIMMAKEDAERIGLQNGDEIILRNNIGEFRGRVPHRPHPPWLPTGALAGDQRNHPRRTPRRQRHSRLQRNG